MKKTWWKEAVVYQIYPRSFLDTNGDGIGDLQGVLSKLDYLKELGIDVIWLCPIYKSPNDDNGYDVSDYQDIMDEFGTMSDFDELLQAAHARGIRVVLDLIPNHTSDEHAWFVESRSSKDNPKRDYYIWRDGKNGKEPNNWASIFNGSAWVYDEQSEQYYLHLYSKRQPDLNLENPVVQQELVKMINWWLDKGIDGFRVDAITHIKKEPGLPDMPNPEHLRYVDATPMHRNVNGIHDMLRVFRNEFVKRDIMTVGEANGVPIEEAELYVGEDQGIFNMIFHFEHMDLDFGPEGRWDFAPFRLQRLKEITKKWQTGLEGRGWNALYMENHDQPRSVSRFGDDKKFRKASAKLLATYYMMLQGTPYIYQGQEIGLTNVSFDSIDEYKDVEIHNFYRERGIDGHDVEDTMRRIRYRARDNARTPMQWNGSVNAGFTTGSPWIKVNPNFREINVEQDLHDPESIYRYYQMLIQLRRSYEVFVYGRYDDLLAEHSQLFAYTRTFEDQTGLVLLNFSRETCSLPGFTQFSGAKLLVSNCSIEDADLTKDFVMHPYEARVYLLS